MLLLGDCLDVLPHWPDNSFDLVCTDPPYHLTQDSRNVGGERAVETKGFMGQAWDGGDIAFRPEVWREVLRVAKPGAWLTAFGGARTFHRLVCAIEDAGWEVRDCLMWLYGTGFPKSLNVGKALDKAAGKEREVLGVAGCSGSGRSCMNDAPGNGRKKDYLAGEYYATAPATELAKLYDGYGTALKPSYEPVVLARKPLAGTVAQNVQQYGTGGLNIDASRIEYTSEGDKASATPQGSVTSSRACGGAPDVARTGRKQFERPVLQGRWPPNVLLGHAADCTEEACCQECPVRQLDGQSGVTKSSGGGMNRDTNTNRNVYSKGQGHPKIKNVGHGDIGGASRFLPRFHYSSKTSRKERAGSSHPTIKPLAVVEWLLRLTAPPGKPMVLDPFVGSGTTLIAAHRLGIEAVGIEQEPEHVEQAYQRYRSMT